MLRKKTGNLHLTPSLCSFGAVRVCKKRSLVLTTLSEDARRLMQGQKLLNYMVMAGPTVSRRNWRKPDSVDVSAEPKGNCTLQH